MEEFLRAVALHPGFQDADVLRLLGKLGERDLVRAPGAFDLYAIHRFRPRPTLRAAEDDHRPRPPPIEAVLAGVALDLADAFDHAVERRRHQLVHCRRIVALDEVGLVTVAFEKVHQLFVAYAREHRRAGDLVAVQVKDWEYGAVARRVEELVGVPARRERPRFGFRSEER